MGGHYVSSEKGLIDIDIVCALLGSTYWADKRPRKRIEASIGNSICFGVYENDGNRQVGFARAVTDGATFTWVCDVVVDGAARGNGLGKLLMASVMEHPALKGTTMILRTRDAHGLYEQYGFKRMEMMLRPSPGDP
jgi:GNAT superfamily N-acetyltransferase